MDDATGFSSIARYEPCAAFYEVTFVKPQI
jgi:hypothetical protein